MTASKASAVLTGRKKSSEYLRSMVVTVTHLRLHSVRLSIPFHRVKYISSMVFVSMVCGCCDQLLVVIVKNVEIYVEV